MKRLRLGAISAAIAAGLAVSYGVLAHDFSALKDGSGNAVRAAGSDCVETSGSVNNGTACAKATAAAAAAPAAAAKEMAAEKAAAPAAAASAAAATTATAAKASGPSGLANVKDGSGKTVTAGAGGCVESTGGSTDGCAPTAQTTAAAPTSTAAAPAAAAPAAAVASADGSTAMGNHQAGEATHGHLADGQKAPVKTGFGGCVNLGYSANSPDHPGECAFQAGKAVAAAPAAAAAKPAATAAARPVPAAPAAAVPGTVRNTGPIGDAGAGAAAMADGVADSSNEFPMCAKRKARSGALVDDCAAPDGSGAMAKAAPAAPPVSVPGTVRNTSPIGVESSAAAAMAADAAPTGSSETFPQVQRQRAPRGALTDDGATAADSSDVLPDSPPPPPIPAPPTQVVRGQDRPMDIPAPARQADSGPAPVAPAAAVPGTVRNTAPTGADSGAPAGNVQMPAAKAAPIPAPEYEKISLSADVLFKFDRYREKDMLPAGRAKLDDVADKINNYIVDTIDHIDLTGHTDRLGSDAYNQRLSERRAKTVKGYLVKKGVDGSKIATKGHGEREPVVQCKGNKATKKLIRCLQPNRRVDVEIHGVKQK